jgi:lysine 2,3-aminomutase
MPQYLISMSPTKVVLRNYEGVIATYAEPQYIDDGWERENGYEVNYTGVAQLLEAKENRSIEPANLERRRRNAKGKKKLR